jgi:tripartite-type tricarboxylate transporter receptor subunit TctC
MHRFLHILACGLLALHIVPVLAQPAKDTRTIKIVVITSPGASADFTARLIAEKLGQRMGRTVIVENKPGAGGNLATEFVARSPGDGTTLLLTANNHNINPALYEKTPYDPEKDLAAVIQVAQGPGVLVAHPSVPINSVKELLAELRAKPDSLSYASGGIGNPGHIQGELFKFMSGTRMVHVPYKGAAPAIADAVAGQIPLAFGSLVSAMTFIKAGKLKALGVTSPHRWPGTPDIPTIAESVPGYSYDVWLGIFAPKATPAAMVAEYNREIAAILATPDVRDKILAQGMDVVGKPVAEFEQMLRDDLAKSVKLVKEAGIKAE